MAKDLIVRPPPGAVTLPDDAQWELKFQIRSESSNRIYYRSLNLLHGQNQFEEKKRTQMS